MFCKGKLTIADGLVGESHAMRICVADSPTDPRAIRVLSGKLARSLCDIFSSAEFCDINPESHLHFTLDVGSYSAAACIKGAETLDTHKAQYHYRSKVISCAY